MKASSRVLCVPSFGGRREAEPTRRRQRHRSTEFDDIACEGRESDVEFLVAAVPSEAPSPAVLRRRLRHRDVVAPSDYYRASTTQSETRRCTPPLSLKLLKLPLSRVPSCPCCGCMLCVLCVSFSSIILGHPFFLVTLLALVFGCNSYTVIIDIAVFSALLFAVIL